MTTGNITRDTRVSVYTNSGPGHAGHYFRKIWEGGDYAQRALAYNVWVKPHYESSLRDLDGIVGQTSRLSVFSNRKYDKFLVEGHYRTVWKKPPRRAGVEYHSYSASWVEYNDPVMQWGFPGSYGNVGYTGTVHSAFGPPHIFGDPWSSNDDIALIGKLRTMLVGSDFHLGNFLGESHQALRLIADSATKIARSLKRLKRGNFMGATRALFGSRLSDWEIRARKREFYHRIRKPMPPLRKLTVADVATDAQVSSYWLELQYGWLPLLKDAQGAAEMLAHHLNTPLQLKVRVSRNAGGVPGKTEHAPYFIANVRPVKIWITSRTSLIAILKEKDVAQLSGLTDYASVAWEVMPWSFVIDWFIPIGNWLGARGVSQGLTGTFVSSHIYREEYRTFDPTVRMSPGGYSVSSPSYFYREGNFARSVSNTLSVPLPTVKPLGKIASWLHCGNAVALLSQVASKVRS